MKRIFLPIFFCIISIFLLCTNPASAQLTQSNFSIGPRIGVNFSNVSDPEEAELLTGLVLGLTSTYSINENSGITVDALYSREGYEIVGTGINLNYLRIPVLYNIFFGELGQKFRPKVFLGPQLGFLMTAKVGESDIKYDMNKFSFGLGAGLGFNYRIGSRVWLNTDLRSYFDLNKISDNAIDYPEEPRIRNIQLSVGIAWGL